MNKDTRYRYEQRIKLLEKEVQELQNYKSLAHDLFRSITEYMQENKVLSQAWIVRQFMRVMK